MLRWNRPLRLGIRLVGACEGNCDLHITVFVNVKAKQMGRICYRIIGYGYSRERGRSESIVLSVRWHSIKYKYGYYLVRPFAPAWLHHLVVESAYKIESETKKTNLNQSTASYVFCLWSDISRMGIRNLEEKRELSLYISNQIQSVSATSSAHLSRPRSTFLVLFFSGMTMRRKCTLLAANLFRQVNE